MVQTGAGDKNIFWKVEQIFIADMHVQSHGYFGLIDIGNLTPLPNHLERTTLKKLSTSTQEVQKFYDRVLLDMIYKAIESSIKNTALKKLRLHWSDYEWYDDGGLIRNDGSTHYALFSIKNIQTIYKDFFSNLKDKIYKETLANDGNNVKDLIYDVVKSVDVCPSTGLSIRCPSLGLK